MSLRVILCFLVVFVLCVMAWRGKWFLATCGAVVMMAFLEHRDMPRHILGIPGMNLWNVLILNIVGAWLKWRAYQGLSWDVPRAVKTAFFLYLIIVFSAFFRAFIDPTEYYEYGRLAIVQDSLINPLKFLIPGLIFYDGCRTREQVTWALGAVVLTYLILAVLVIKSMGLGNFSGAELGARAARVIPRDVGYNRVDMSMMLAGASWAIFAFSRLARSWKYRVGLWAAAGLALIGQALTGGRAGYVTWGVIGFTLCILKWRKLLPLLPVAVAVAVTFMPGVRERMLQGFGVRQGNVVVEENSDEITAGRVNAWPYVIAKIKQAPLFGYGRMAMVRTGVSSELAEEIGDGFNHPHNAYLEMLLDNGLVGFFCVIPLYLILLRRLLGLFRDPEDRLVEVAGGVALSLLLALLVASMGAQTLYPREGVVEMWAALGVALRVSVARREQPVPGWMVNEAAEEALLEEPDWPADSGLETGSATERDPFPVSRQSWPS